MKYLKHFELLSDDIEDGDIVISTVTELPYLIKNHKYVIVDKNGYKISMLVMDIVNNQKFRAYKSDFIPEYEEASKKYNL